MDAIQNPFSPGAGSPPPELAGRSAVRSAVDVCLARLQIGKQAKSVIMVGLRGVGKTVLLDQMLKDAEAKGFCTVRIEAPENRSLPALLAPQIRLTLLRLSKIDAAKDYAVRGLRALAGLKLTFNDIEVGIDFDAEPGLADNGDLESDLTALFEQVGLAAQQAKTVLVIFMDELQYVKEEQLAALISALHRCSQKQLPVTVVGAGLPQLIGRMGEAKSYAERLFEFPVIGALEERDARDAIEKPIRNEGAEIEKNAVDAIVDLTQSYPYFLQEWGSRTWAMAPQSPINVDDVNNATATTVAALDESFFRVRFDRLTMTEKKYLRAMAALGSGPHRSGDIADKLSRKVQAVAPVRSSLINKGMVYSPTHGDTAFTAPLFDEFMMRIMPD